MKIDELRAACDRADARTSRGYIPLVNLAQGEIVATTEELRALLDIAEAAAVATSNDCLCALPGCGACHKQSQGELALREALARLDAIGQGGDDGE